MKRLKVTLVVPNFRWSKWDHNTLWHYFPYNLSLLAAMVVDICEVTILDAYQANMSQEEFKVALKRHNPDIVGITVLIDQYANSAHCAAKITKSLGKDIKVILGGVYATMNPEEAIRDQNIDFVVIGEGKYVFRDLINYFLKKNSLPGKGICYRLNGEIINRGHTAFIQDLDALPFPAYHLINFQKYANNAHRKSVDLPRAYPYARVITSRGCPFGCIFCQVESLSGKKFRARSVNKILNELLWLKNTYNIKSIIFDDDNLLADKKRAEELFQRMIDLNLAMPWVAIATAVFKLDEKLIKLMRASGCEYIDIAIESGTERVLKEIIRKPVNLEHAKEMVSLAREEGIFVAANFIIGFPTETWDEIRQTVKFAEEIDADYVKLFAAMPLRNTKLRQLCEREKSLKKDFYGLRVHWNTGQIETKDFKANDLTILRAYEWDRINFTCHQKRKRIAEMMGVSEDELYAVRRMTIDAVCKNIK